MPIPMLCPSIAEWERATPEQRLRARYRAGCCRGSASTSCKTLRLNDEWGCCAAAPMAPRNRMRAKVDLSKHFKLIWAVQSCCEKYSALLVGQIITTRPRHPVLAKRGASRSSRVLGAGCDGREGVARGAMSMRPVK